MTAKSILEEIRPLGSDSYKRVMVKHGVKEPFFGVKISELQKIVKRVKKDYQLALDLYDTGNYDAMYLAGLIADDEKMTRKDLQRWVEKAYCRGLTGATVAWVAAGSPQGWAAALDWIEDKAPLIASAGWSTLGSIVAIRADADLDLAALKRLLQRVQKTLPSAPDLVRYAMNSFVIAVGCYVKPLSSLAIQVGETLGHVTVDLGDTACEVPYGPDYIKKVEQRGSIGKKRKSAKC
ncbi:MAG: DNA alkylation repair protein [Opitutaceae bacterium]